MIGSFINLFYWLGYLKRIGMFMKIQTWAKFPFIGPFYAFVATCIIIPSLYYHGGNTITTISAIHSLRTGIAQQYLEQYKTRMNILTDENIHDVVLEPLYDMPYLLFFHDIQPDASAWENYTMSQYFHKNSVRLSQGSK